LSEVAVSYDKLSNEQLDWIPVKVFLHRYGMRRFGCLLNRAGINLRFLGEFWKLLKNAKQKSLVVLQIIARSARNAIKSAMREELRRSL
jgi:hypothetical protein